MAQRVHRPVFRRKYKRGGKPFQPPTVSSLTGLIYFCPVKKKKKKSAAVSHKVANS